MKFIIDNWMLILMATTSGGFLLWQTIQKGAGSGVGTAEAVRLINREKGVLIDVREPSEFAAGHAVGARNVPLGTIDGSKDLPTNKTLPLVLLWLVLLPLSTMDATVTTNLSLGQQLPWLPAALLGMVIQTGTEELIFRGYLQQSLAARFRSAMSRSR